jgi:DNA-binding SARP family transcriptional activator
MDIRPPAVEHAAYAQRVRFFVLGLLACADRRRSEGADLGAASDLEGADLGGLKQRGVLAHLIANIGEVVHDDSLLEGVWGVAAPLSRSSNLQSYVSKLRRLIGPIDRVGGGYRLLGAPGEVDAHRFEALLTAGQSSEDRVRAHEILTEAEALWRGPAYADCRDLPGLAPTVRRLEDLRFAAQERRLELDLELGRHAAVVGELEALVHAHPFRESLTAMYMTALYRSGRQAEALRAAETLRITLREELGVDLSGEVASLEMQILEHDPGLALDPADRSRIGENRVESDPRFVGRSAALQRIHDGHRGSEVVLVTGTSGVGKTALLTAAASRIAGSQRTAVLLTTRCREALSGADHFGPMRPILGQLAGDLERSLDRSLPVAEQAERLRGVGAVSLRLVLELCPQVVGSLVSAGDVDRRAAGLELEHSARQRSTAMHGGVVPPDTGLAFALAECLGALGRHVPTVLIVDDLEWVDPASLDVLDRILERGPGVRMLAAHRPDSLPDHVAAFIGKVQRRTGMAPIDLDDLAADEARAFVDDLVVRDGDSVPDTVRERIAALSQGNGLYATELVRHYVTHGRVDVDDQGPVGASLPTRIDALLAGRLAELDDRARRFLAVAAVEGESFTVESTARVAATPLADAIRLCSGELAERRIVAPDGHRASGAIRLARYRFVHSLFRARILSHLDEVELADLRSRVADALVEVGASGIGSRVSVVPRLYELAGKRTEAIPHIAAEAESFIRRGLNDEAATLLRRALRYAGDAGLDDSTLSRLHARLGFAVSVTEGFAAPGVERSYARASELLGRAGVDRTTMPLAFGLWMVYTSRGDFERADRLVRAMSTVTSDHSDAIGFQTQHAAWTTAVFAGRLDEAEHGIRRALASYRTVQHHPTTFSFGNHDPGVCAGALGSVTAALRGQAMLSYQRITEARRLADTVGHGVSMAQVRGVGVWAAALLGGPSAVEEFAADHGTDSIAPLWNLLEQGLRSWAAHRRHPDAENRRRLQDTMQKQFAMANDTFGAVLGVKLTDLLIRDGDLTEADEVLTLVEKHTEPMVQFMYDAEIRRMRGRWREHRGDAPAARQAYAHAAEIADGQGALTLAARAHADLERVGA